MYRLPLFLFSGIEMTMWSSWFARQMYPAEIGLVMIPFGLAEFVAGTFAFGWISDKIGRWALLIPGTACMCVLQAPLSLWSFCFCCILSTRLVSSLPA